MRDSLLIVPDTPAGVDPAMHYRELLAAARCDAAAVAERLHLEPDASLRDAAAHASTALRELRQAARDAIERRCDDQAELLVLLGALDVALESGDHVLMNADLRVALEHDLAAWDAVSGHALVIGELSGGMFMGFSYNELRDMALLREVEARARVPLMHAIMRAIVAGILQSRAEPLGFEATHDRFDELLHKSMTQLGPVLPDAPMRHLRFATIAGCALWNLARIAQRDDMTPERAAAFVRDRREALAGIRAETRLQQLEFGVLPDYERAYDMGVAYGIVEPILARCAEHRDVHMPLRADAAAWYDLLGSSPT